MQPKKAVNKPITPMKRQGTSTGYMVKSPNLVTSKAPQKATVKPLTPKAPTKLYQSPTQATLTKVMKNGGSNGVKVGP